MLNQRLALKVSDWFASGCPAQESFDWSRARNNWRRDITEHSIFIDALPDRLDRKYVRRLCESELNSSSEKFVTAMIWGYGDLGYGSYRTRKMFSTPDFVEKVERSHSLARDGLVLEAYEYLARNKIEQLGPAFGTKWLSFSSPRNNPSPIYDSFIAKWIKKFGGKDFEDFSMSSETWSVRTFSTYMEWMRSHSSELGIKLDDLELVMFQDATEEFSTMSRWRGL